MHAMTVELVSVTPAAEAGQVLARGRATVTGLDATHLGTALAALDQAGARAARAAPLDELRGRWLRDMGWVVVFKM